MTKLTEAQRRVLPAMADVTDYDATEGKAFEMTGTYINDISSGTLVLIRGTTYHFLDDPRAGRAALQQSGVEEGD